MWHTCTRTCLQVCTPIEDGTMKILSIISQKGDVFHDTFRYGMRAVVGPVRAVVESLESLREEPCPPLVSGGLLLEPDVAHLHAYMLASVHTHRRRHHEDLIHHQPEG